MLQRKAYEHLVKWKNTPDKKVSGIIKKFWNMAIWSNFSAIMPASKPRIAIMAVPNSAKRIIHSKLCGMGRPNQAVTATTPMPTASPRTIAALI